MTPKIKKLQYKNDYIYHILFEDKREADVDFSSFLWGEAFEDLKDKSIFKKASIDKITGTITWPNGVDLASEAIYQKLSTSSKSSNPHIQR
jgi:hypothetical protein